MVRHPHSVRELMVEELRHMVEVVTQEVRCVAKGGRCSLVGPSREASHSSLKCSRTDARVDQQWRAASTLFDDDVGDVHAR